MSDPPVIAIVDDDEAVREALCDLLQVEGLSARAFASADAFLGSEEAAEVDCVVTDVRMPGMTGLELQQELRARGASIPVIFITSSVNEASRAQALRDGAAAWFTKPVADQALLATLRRIAGGSDRPSDRPLPGP